MAYFTFFKICPKKGLEMAKAISYNLISNEEEGKENETVYRSPVVNRALSDGGRGACGLGESTAFAKGLHLVAVGFGGVDVLHRPIIGASGRLRPHCRTERWFEGLSGRECAGIGVQIQVDQPLCEFGQSTEAGV